MNDEFSVFTIEFVFLMYIQVVFMALVTVNS